MQDNTESSTSKVAEKTAHLLSSALEADAGVERPSHLIEDGSDGAVTAGNDLLGGLHARSLLSVHDGNLDDTLAKKHCL